MFTDVRPTRCHKKDCRKQMAVCCSRSEKRKEDMWGKLRRYRYVLDKKGTGLWINKKYDCLISV